MSQNPSSQELRVPLQSVAPDKKLLSKALICQRSGLILGELTVCIFEGHMPYWQSHSESVWLHPFYNMEQSVLMRKLQDSINLLHAKEWIGTPGDKERIQLLVSALLWKVGCIKQDRPCLPPYDIAVASAEPVLRLSGWFYNVSSQRFQFPLYSVSAQNGNLNWSNFREWIGSAFEIIRQWEKGKKEYERKERAQVKRDEAIKALKSESARRLDIRKIWGWIHVHLEPHHPTNRLNVWKDLFLEGDIQYDDWDVDAVEELEFEIYQHCDKENMILHYINRRLQGIKALIQEFNNSFTIISSVSEDKFGTDGQTPQEAAMIEALDTRLEQIGDLGPEPQRKDFATMGLYMKALATWRLLKRRSDSKDSSDPKGT